MTDLDEQRSPRKRISDLEMQAVLEARNLAAEVASRLVDAERLIASTAPLMQRAYTTWTPAFYHDKADYDLLFSAEHSIDKVLDALHDCLRCKIAPVAYGKTGGWNTEWPDEVQP